eukprot:3840886-Prymnesium_polylepis.1
MPGQQQAQQSPPAQPARGVGPEDSDDDEAEGPSPSRATHAPDAATTERARLVDEVLTCFRASDAAGASEEGAADEDDTDGLAALRLLIPELVRMMASEDVDEMEAA